MAGHMYEGGEQAAEQEEEEMEQREHPMEDGPEYATPAELDEVVDALFSTLKGLDLGETGAVPTYRELRRTVNAMVGHRMSNKKWRAWFRNEVGLQLQRLDELRQAEEQEQEQHADFDDDY